MFQIEMLIALALLVGVDQLTKNLAMTHLANKAVPLIPKVFELRLTVNDGAAFSILSGQRWLLILLPLIVSAGLIALCMTGRFRQKKLANIGCLLIAAGGIGNLIDRIVSGEVVDFLYFKLIDFPIFNFADCCVTVGAVLVLIFVVFFYEEGKKKGDKADETNVALSDGTDEHTP